MVKISPVQIWKDGKKKQATVLTASINDNMKDTGMVYYRLLSEEGEQLAEGNLWMTGEAYHSWVDNEQAYAWMAAPEQLDVEILGPVEEVQPVIEEPVVEEEGE